MIGWRGAVWVAAFTMAGVVLPLVWWGTEILRRDGEPPMQRTSDKGTWGQALRTGRFWMLAAIFAFVALNHWMLVNFAVPIFTERGAPQGLAVTAASVIGPAQVAGRLLVLMRYESRIGTMAATQLTFLGMSIGIGCLWLAGLDPRAIFGFAVVQGGAIGVMTILRPVLIAEVMGPAGYGAIAGTIQIPALLGAPVVGAMVLSTGAGDDRAVAVADPCQPRACVAIGPGGVTSGRLVSMRCRSILKSGPARNRGVLARRRASSCQRHAFGMTPPPGAALAGLGAELRFRSDLVEIKHATSPLHRSTAMRARGGLSCSNAQIGCGASCQMSAAPTQLYSAAQSGLRFSRKAAMPSAVSSSSMFSTITAPV